MSDNVKKKVFVGLSGGVDSAVSAYLLVQQGYDVEGVFIQTWTPEWMECGWRDDRRDAMRVAIHLGIPFHDLDLSREYKEGVADYMISEYRAGRTPNPDVMCNREVKFGGFLRYALSRGADYVATGHYARVSDSRPSLRGGLGRGVSNIKIQPVLETSAQPPLTPPLEREGNLHLLKGLDTTKDQSYFLWTLTNEQLKHVLFPVGGLPKSETRKIAERAALPVATKKDSQGICFLGAIDMEEFLSHYIEHKIGNILDVTGNKIGTHTGVWFVTLGQRFAGDIIDSEYRGKPLFVTAKDTEHNTITVSLNKEDVEVINSNELHLESVVFRHHIESGKEYTCQVRYHGEFHEVEVVSYSESGVAATIRFTNQSHLAAPGQSIVLYDADVCIGGGIIA